MDAEISEDLGRRETFARFAQYVDCAAPRVMGVALGFVCLNLEALQQFQSQRHVEKSGVGEVESEALRMF